MPRGSNRMTIYDVMDANGVFDSNPANTFAVDSTGQSIYSKQEFPVMVYHPLGEERVQEPGAVENTPFGPVLLGRRMELISRTAANVKELRTLLAAGWHLHPADSIAAAGKSAPARDPATAEAMRANAEIAALREELATLKAREAAREADEDSDGLAHNPDALSEALGLRPSAARLA